jgi:peptidoglycan/xylan/chitin deacetylase (PgdA/CDA1 family)
MQGFSNTSRSFKHIFLLIRRSVVEWRDSSFMLLVSCCQEATSNYSKRETRNFQLLNDIRFTLHASRITCLVLTMLLVSAVPSFTQAQVIKSGPSSCPGVALTFDLCPVRNGTGYDQALIDYLIEQKIPATFFMSGRWIAKHDRQVKALLQVPFFEIGTHGEVHAHMPFHSAEEQEQEILGPVRLLKAKYNRDATLFRPPYGEFNDDTVNVTRSLGLQFILWDVVSGDPDPTLTADQIEGRLRRFVRKGSVIVMHANGKGKHTHEAVQDLQEHLLPQRHLTPMTVSDLLRCSQAAP